MVEENVKLIHKILDGEEDAFGVLVQKYQKRIHALAWRKVGDYHIAEEITQDVLLQVYHKLPTLKNPKVFDGWLYVIVERLCINWKTRNRAISQSIEDTPVVQVEESIYQRYQSEQRSLETIEEYRRIVKLLLEKLPESERTVITLYYLGEMTANDISQFLGVSVNTIKSRLRRAKIRLKAEEQLFISEISPSLQLSTDLTETILKQIAELKPAPPVSKPFLPWAAVGTTVFLILLMLGATDKYITSFQKPYNFQALSEPTIEIIESPVRFDAITKPKLRQQVGRANLDTSKDGVGVQLAEEVATEDLQDIAPIPARSNWIQTGLPKSTSVYNLFATSENDLYAVASSGIYKLTADATVWVKIKESDPMSTSQAFVTEERGTIYVVNHNQILTSIDEGKTWDVLCQRPIGKPMDLIIRDHTEDPSMKTLPDMYLVLRNEGVYHFLNSGKMWKPVNHGLKETRITGIATIENVVFLGAQDGLYRWDSGSWRELAVDTFSTVQSIAVSENHLYVLTDNPKNTEPRKLFHTSDLGKTWTDVTPPDKSLQKRETLHKPIQILANGKALFILGVLTFRSTDRGNSWENLGNVLNSLMPTKSHILELETKSIFRADQFTIYRSNDRGTSWHSYMKGIAGTNVLDLRVFEDSLYINTSSGIFVSIDNGLSWKNVQFAIDSLKHRVQHSVASKLAIVDNELFVIIPIGEQLNIFKLQDKDGELSLVQTIPSYADSKTQITEMDINQLITVWSSNNSPDLYIKHNCRIIKWNSTSLKYTDSDLSNFLQRGNLKNGKGSVMAASANCVYAGMRDGRLLQSHDGGIVWHEITPYTFPKQTPIHDITFVGTTVYVATDRGVFWSETGEYWDTITGHKQKNIVIHQFATDGFRLFGADDRSVYQLDSQDVWKQISSSIPDEVTSLSVNRDKLYIATKEHGIYHLSLKDEATDIRIANIQ